MPTPLADFGYPLDADSDGLGKPPKCRICYQFTAKANTLKPPKGTTHYPANAELSGALVMEAKPQ